MQHIWAHSVQSNRPIDPPTDFAFYFVSFYFHSLSSVSSAFFHSFYFVDYSQFYILRTQIAQFCVFIALTRLYSSVDCIVCHTKYYENVLNFSFFFCSQVPLTVYYESLCPDSAKFIVEQLHPTKQSPLGRYIEVTLIPFGKASVSIHLVSNASQNNTKCHTSIFKHFLWKCGPHTTLWWVSVVLHMCCTKLLTEPIRFINCVLQLCVTCLLVSLCVTVCGF